MSGFKRWLSVWVASAMALGLALGSLFPEVFSVIGGLSVYHVNPVTAVVVWFLIVPSMVQMDYAQLGRVWASRSWRLGSALTTTTNWLVKPLAMTLIATLFLHSVFAPWLDPADADDYLAGLILLGIAPCTGMVFVWSRMTGGDPTFTLGQVALNDIILLFAFAPMAGVLLGASGIEVPWNTVITAVGAFVIVPMIAGYLLQRVLSALSDGGLDTFGKITGPLTNVGLIALVVLLFGFQAETIIGAPLTILMVATPVIATGILIFVFAFGSAYVMGLPAQIAAPAALIGTSNFFELAVAIAVALFGVNSPAVVATVVGLLVEIPVMLGLVVLVNKAAGLFSSRSAQVHGV